MLKWLLVYVKDTLEISHSQCHKGARLNLVPKQQIRESRGFFIKVMFTL